MNARMSVYMIIFSLLSACGVIANPTATPIQKIPTLPSLDEGIPTATAFIPSLETATIEVLEQTATQTQQPTAFIPTLDMVIVTVPEQTAISQPTACQLQQNWVIYIVQSNDTLLKLSERTGVSVAQIQRANCLTSTLIFAGQLLYLPFIPLPPTISTFPTLTPVETSEAPGPGDPIVIITPESGSPGTQFTMQIDNFEAKFEVNEPITIRIIHVLTFTKVFEKNSTIDNLGNLVDPYLSPTNALAGAYTVDVFGSSSAASGEFMITNPP